MISGRKYKITYVLTDKDLPVIDGYYFAAIIGAFRTRVDFIRYNQGRKEFWLKRVKWYLKYDQL